MARYILDDLHHGTDTDDEADTVVADPRQEQGARAKRRNLRRLIEIQQEARLLKAYIRDELHKRRHH